MFEWIKNLFNKGNIEKSTTLNTPLFKSKPVHLYKVYMLSEEEKSIRVYADNFTDVPCLNSYRFYIKDTVVACFDKSYVKYIKIAIYSNEV